MPVIDVCAPADIFPADADEKLGNELIQAVLRWEGPARLDPFHPADRVIKGDELCR